MSLSLAVCVCVCVSISSPLPCSRTILKRIVHRAGIVRYRFVLGHVVYSTTNNDEEVFGLLPTKWSWILNSNGLVDAEPNLPNVRAPPETVCL